MKKADILLGIRLFYVLLMPSVNSCYIAAGGRGVEGIVAVAPKNVVVAVEAVVHGDRPCGPQGLRIWHGSPLKPKCHVGHIPMSSPPYRVHD